MNAKESTPSVLTERQRKFLGFVLCCAGALLLGGLITALVYVLNLAFDLFSGVIWSLAVSGMLAILLRPIVSFFRRKNPTGAHYLHSPALLACRCQLRFRNLSVGRKGDQSNS